MTKNPKHIRPKALAVEALSLMTEKSKYIQVLLVVDDSERVAGVLHIQDLFKARIV
jgi:CBS domain-containing protein